MRVSGGNPISIAEFFNQAANTLPSPYYRFDGDGDYVEMADDANLDVGTGDFSIHLKFRPLDLASAEQYLINKEAGGIGWGLELKEDDLWIRLDDGTVDVSAIISASAFSDNTEVDVFVTFDRDGNALAYVNGLLSGVAVDISTAALTLDNAGVMRVATESGGTTYEFEGQFVLVELFNLNLTAAEVAAYANGGTPFKYWKANQTENLTEGAFATHANWDATNDFVDTGGNATFTWSANQTSTLTQTQANLAVAGVGAKRYRFTYDLAEPVAFDGDGAITITNSFGSVATTIPLTAGTGLTIEFTSKSSPTDFVISIVSGSDTQGTYVLDNLSLIQIGGIAGYDSATMGISSWFDKHNGNDGTVTNATLANEVAAMSLTDKLTITADSAEVMLVQKEDGTDIFYIDTTTPKVVSLVDLYVPATSLYVGSEHFQATDASKINGITAGTKAASKALVADAAGNIDNIVIGRSALPALEFKDTDCAVTDVNASINIDASDTGDGTEDIDVRMSQQVAGSLTNFLFSDADGDLTLGHTTQNIAFNGNLLVDEYIYHNGDLDTYIKFQSDNISFIVGGHTAFVYAEDATSTLGIDAEGLADISFGGGNVVFGGAEGNFDGNVGINVVPEIWHGDLSVVQLGGNGAWSSSTTAGATKLMTLSHNSYVALADGLWKYQNTDEASAYRQLSGTHVFRVAGSGTVDTDITWIDALTIANDANVGIGVSSLENWQSGWRALQIGGNAALFAHATPAASRHLYLTNNLYHDGSFKTISTDESNAIAMLHGTFVFKVGALASLDSTPTFTDALTIANNANVGIETENLATWTSTVSALQVGGTAGLSSETTQADGTKTWVSANAYHSSSTDTWKYISTNASDEANSIMFSDGAVRFRTAIAGVADAGISWINQLVLQNNSGSLSATFGGDIIVPVGNKIHLELDQEYFISSGSTIQVFTGGAKRFTFETGAFRAANGGAIQNAGSSATVPTLTPNDDYTGYGIGGLISGGFISGIANSTEGWRLVEDTSNVTMHYPEATTPTAIASYWSIYGKADNLLYFQDGAGVEYTVGGTPSFKSYTVSDFGNSDSHYTAGFYSAPVEDVTLTIGGSVTQTYGTAGQSHAAHAFCVASGAGGTDLVLTVTGVSITDAGVKNDADSEIIVADTDTATTDAYYETSKKWLGQITYTLTGSAGAFTFNYGFCKYEDWGNRAFTLTDFETTGKMGASETGLNIELLHHKATGWTYHASAFVPGTGALTSLSTDHGTNNDVANDEHFAYKRASLATAVDGSASEGLVIKVTTAVNNSIDYMNSHIGVTL